MINKDKTIKKALMRYDEVKAVPGKRSLYDCFFCLKGEYFFVFMSKDKKVHILKAFEHYPVFFTRTLKNDKASLFEVLNKPIFIRSIITQKPVKTCLVNLFPIPCICWSNERGADTDSKKSENSKRIKAPSNLAHTHNTLTTDTLAACNANSPDSFEQEFIHASTPDPFTDSNWLEEPNYRIVVHESGNLPLKLGKERMSILNGAFTLIGDEVADEEY